MHEKKVVKREGGKKRWWYKHTVSRFIPGSPTGDLGMVWNSM